MLLSPNVNKFFTPINKNGDCEILAAARADDLETFKKLYASVCTQKLKIWFENHTNKQNKTVLHEAVQYGSEHVVKLLLNDVEMDPDCLKQGDWTPLMLACAKSREKVVEMLTEVGANYELRNKDGWTAFHIAAREGNCAILTLLLALNSNLWNTASKNGRTPLHTMALYGRDEAVRLVLTKCKHIPADVEDACGSTPLMDACRSGHTAVANALLHFQGADIMARDRLGRQAVHLTAEAGALESLDFIISELNVFANTKTEDGYTLAHFAAKEGHLQLLRYLSKLECDMNEADQKHGRTPLHMAAIGRHQHCIAYLCEELNISDQKDFHGKLAQDYAFNTL